MPPSRPLEEVSPWQPGCPPVLSHRLHRLGSAHSLELRKARALPPLRKERVAQQRAPVGKATVWSPSRAWHRVKAQDACQTKCTHSGSLEAQSLGHRQFCSTGSLIKSSRKKAHHVLLWPSESQPKCHGLSLRECADCPGDPDIALRTVSWEGPPPVTHPSTACFSLLATPATSWACQVGGR